MPGRWEHCRFGAPISKPSQHRAENARLTSKPFAVNLVTEFSQQERLEECLEEGVPIISFFWRDPGSLVKRAKAGGAHVMYTVGNADDARRAVDSGVDVIVAQGWEAGGHVGGRSRRCLSCQRSLMRSAALP